MSPAGRFLRRRHAVFFGSVICIAAYATAEPSGPATQPGSPADATTATLAPVIVTAEKRAEPEQDVPQSITAISGHEVQDAGVHDLRDTQAYVPNLVYSDFSAPRETFPFIRGIGSGQNEPAVTTYYDGVPQLSFSTADLELYDVDHIEFLRGPQSTLYGRDALGGVINIYHREPTNDLHASEDTTFGSYGLQDYRAAVSGPIIKDQLFYSVSGGFTQRQGYSVNTFDGDRLDSRDHLFGRGELLWTPTDRLEVRLMVNGERDHDGDFPLYDLDALRQDPLRVDHNFTGGADRDVDQTALTATYHGTDADFTSISAYQEWSSRETTDLDETALNAADRLNQASEHNLIQEFRLSSPADAPLILNSNAKLKWLVGLFAFRQDQNSYVDNSIFLPTAFDQITASDGLNYGIGVFGDTTLTLWNKLDLGAGLRYDYEHRSADIANSTDPLVMPNSSVIGAREFEQVSPRFTVGYHWTPDLFTYTSAAEGYKAGGFNSYPAPGKDSFSPETSWTYELGTKTSWLKDSLIVNADVFYINWNNMQLDVPTPGAPSTFYTDNVGKAQSTGIELEGTYHVTKAWDLFGGLGTADAIFLQYTQPSGVSAQGNRLPFAPDVTWNAGTQYTLRLPHDLRAYARTDVLGVGRYEYDASNAASQPAYVLANFRVGVGANHWRLEGYIDNAFNTHYVPIAYPFPGSASGYVGESGDPQTVGVTLGFTY